jgi:hypothetical protein
MGEMRTLLMFCTSHALAYVMLRLLLLNYMMIEVEFTIRLLPLKLMKIRNVYAVMVLLLAM